MKVLKMQRGMQELDQNGQGIVEFLFFLPFMLMMYSVTVSLSGSMNASINQQKVARSFFYYRMMNNSTFPKPRRSDDGEPSDAWKKFGFQIIGWAENLAGGNESPVAPCYKFRLPLGEGADDECDEKYTGSSSQFIRIQTVYGVCGATYFRNDEGDRISFPKSGTPDKGNVVPTEHCKIL